jgi:NAD(P)-dependent dehydrogenase (short-subunit alcohol dehydrogenase family)
MRLRDKVAIVTGGGAGIGGAICTRFAEEGARVVVAEIDPGRGEAKVGSIRKAGGQATFVRTDVAQKSDVEAMVEAAVRAYGAIDVLVCNAAVQLHGEDGRAHEITEELWDRTFAINARGAWLCAKYAIPVMLKQKRGSIIHIASPTGLVGCAPAYTAYSSSKAVMFGLTRVMAAGYGRDNIRVNAIVPGPTDTPLIAGLLSDPATRAFLDGLSPLGRVGKPEEVAELAVFLASDESRYCTGGFYMSDGGLTAI